MFKLKLDTITWIWGEMLEFGIIFFPFSVKIIYSILFVSSLGVTLITKDLVSFYIEGNNIFYYLYWIINNVLFFYLNQYKELLFVFSSIFSP